MSTVSLHNRIRGQRLRDERPDMPPSPGSRGCAPGELCHLLPPCCSNPRRDWLCQTVRLCECTPWVVSVVKSSGALNHSEIPAKIAVFRKGECVSSGHTLVRHPGKSRGPFRRLKWIPAFAGMTIKRKAGSSCSHPSQASSHCADTQYQTTSSYGLEARAGTFPPFFLHHAMPP